MSVISQGTRVAVAVVAASVLLMAGCQSPAPDTSAHQKSEGAKLNKELSKELEDKRKREQEAQ